MIAEFSNIGLNDSAFQALTTEAMQTTTQAVTA